MKIKNMKETKAITLIALVITIIVLLILAGVAISMLSGENGILNITKGAAEKNEKTTVYEQLKLAAMDAMMEGNKPTMIEQQSDLENAIEAQGLTGTTLAQRTGNDGWKVTTSDNDEYVVYSNGMVKEKCLATEITADDYGDTINYSANNIDDWKIFYNDKNNIWLISSDYVALNETQADRLGVTLTDEYEYYVPVVNSDKLLNQDNWKEYVNEKYATIARGGPELTMFLNSYNEKYSKDDGKSIEYRKSDALLKWSDEPESYFADGYGIIGLNSKGKEFYYISKSFSENGKVNGYQLIKPENVERSMNWYVCYNGTMTRDDASGGPGGLRIVVCLRSDAKAEENAEGTSWTLK